MNRLHAAALILICCLVLGGAASGSVEIIIDNAGASFAGSWGTGTMSTDKFGTDYRTAAISTSGDRAAVYAPVLPCTSSDWEVYAWYPKGGNRTAEAQYLVQHAGGHATVYLNQQTNGGKWNLLGTYTMNAGASCFVQLTNSGSDTTKVVIADAVRFYSASAIPDTAPPAITEVTSLPRYDNATISWMTSEGATTEVEFGTTPQYGIRTAREPAYTANHAVQISGLPPGTAYHYRVRSVDGGGNEAVSADRTFATDSAAPTGSFRGSWLTG